MQVRKDVEVVAEEGVQVDGQNVSGLDRVDVLLVGEPSTAEVPARLGGAG